MTIAALLKQVDAKLEKFNAESFDYCGVFWGMRLELDDKLLQRFDGMLIKLRADISDTTVPKQRPRLVRQACNGGDSFVLFSTKLLDGR